MKNLCKKITNKVLEKDKKPDIENLETQEKIKNFTIKYIKKK